MDAGHTLGRLLQRRADLAGASAQDGSKGEWIDVEDEEFGVDTLTDPPAGA